MRALLLLLIAGAAAAQPAPRPNPDAGPTAYVGGQWYADGAFAARDTVWAEGGVFVDGPLAGAAVVDLGEAFVVPPFADAHVHRVEGPWSLGGVVANHLAAGSFYVKNVNNIPRYARWIADDVNRPEGIDVAFSHGGITAPGAHPLPLYRNLVERGIYRDLVADSLDGVAAYGLATVADLEARWPTILADGPDHIKLLLLDHESGQGLRPDVFRRAVALAREAGLPTTVHVSTAADLALAVDAGADEAAHLPGLFGDPDDYDRYRISPDLAARMADAGFVTVPTSLITSQRRPEAEGAVAENVRRLLAAGAPVAMGTDGFGTSGIDEAANLVRIGAMDGPTALRLLVETGPVSIFPGRAIGRLAPGYESSFLALACDPVADLGCARRITRRVKQGHDLDAAALAETAAAWRALDVATFTAAPRFSDGPLLRGLRHYVDGDLDAAGEALARAQAVAPDSLAEFVRGLRAEVAAEAFDFGAAVALRAEADPSALASVQAGFARFPAPRLAMDAPEATVPFDGLTAPVEVNGVPVRAVVDSGAPGTGLPRALVERLGLRVDTTARGVSRVPSMGLEFEVFAVLVDSVTVGGATLHNVPATVGWTDDEPDPDEPIFLGADVLRHLAAGLRYGYADSTFTIVRDLPETDDRPTFLIDDRSAPVVPVTVAGQPANAILDTGNQQAVYLAAGAFDLADVPVVGTRSGDGWSVDFRDVPLAIPGHPDGPRRAYEGTFVFSADDPVTVILGKPVWAGGTLALDFVNRRAAFEPAGTSPASAE